MGIKPHGLRSALLLLPWFAPPAWAGWYQVRNFEGTIGRQPVHVSLQTYRDLLGQEPDAGKVEGSYYYDAHRTPIPLEGKQAADGTFVLCEASAPKGFGDSPKVPAASRSHPVPCPIAIRLTERGATGRWHDDKRDWPITLQRVGHLDDTGSPVVLDGRVEVPMWYHTRKHLLLGVYRSSKDCPLGMRELVLVDRHSGRIDKRVPFGCGAGTVATPIYLNVYRSDQPGHVTIIFQGGYHDMGEDRDVTIEP